MEPLVALRAGFRRALPPPWLHALGVDTHMLQRLLRGHEGNEDGNSDFAWREVFRVVEDDELCSAELAPLRTALWRVLDQRLTPVRELCGLFESCRWLGRVESYAMCMVSAPKT